MLHLILYYQYKTLSNLRIIITQIQKKNLTLATNSMGTRSTKQQVKINHFLFGKVTQKYQFNKQLITWHKPMVRVDEFIQWQAKYKKAVTMNKESLLLPQNYDNNKIQKFFLCCECPADTEIALTYEKFEYTLEKEVNARKVEMKYFEEVELFFILYKLLEGCKEFQLRGEAVGDIRPEKIVKCKNGDLKMINVASFPQEYTPIEKIMERFDTRTVFFLAPEQLAFLASKGYNAGQYPNAKTQAFSLGLTLLQCATLTSSSDLYKLQPSRSLDKDQLQFRLNSLSPRYKQFPKYLRFICAYQQNDRLSTGELWQCLNTYSSNICQLREFSPKESAEKNAINSFRNKMAKIKAETRNDF